MPICSDCQIEFKKLMFHHDPPLSKIFVNDGTKYFMDKDGEKKLVISHQKNRRLCNKCHRKADKSWGLKRTKFRKIKMKNAQTYDY